MAFWVYVLQCADGKYYTGHSDNLERRIAQHEIGGFCDYTSRRRPVRLMWSETFSTRIEALESERHQTLGAGEKGDAVSWRLGSSFPFCETAQRTSLDYARDERRREA